MALNDEERQRIMEEETLRAEVRSKIRRRRWSIILVVAVFTLFRALRQIAETVQKFLPERDSPEGVAALGRLACLEVRGYLKTHENAVGISCWAEPKGSRRYRVHIETSV
jgi:hypothetical protein